MSSTLPLFLLQAYECASPADVIAMVIRLGRGRCGGTAHDGIPFKWISDEYTVEPRGVDARSTDDRRRDEILQQELQDIAQQLAQQAISFNSQHVRIVYKSVSPVSVQQPEFFNPLIKVMRRRRVPITVIRSLFSTGDVAPTTAGFTVCGSAPTELSCRGRASPMYRPARREAWHGSLILAARSRRQPPRR